MDWQERLDRFVREDDVPGVTLGILVDGELTTFAAGLANRDAGIEATTDTVFQIGSVTKVWTATQIMQLVDRGAVDLDAPVRTYLPDFALADEDAAAKVTVRHLLTHTSGIEGDVFDDVGTNDDCLQRYVEAMATQGTVHGLDETWSYCNSGFVILGRIVEVVTGKSWGAALQEQIGTPLEMQALCTTPSEAILHRAAVGHLELPGTEGLSRAPTWDLPRALGPAGLVTCTVGDLLAFAGMHLDGGRAPDGSSVLDGDTVALMQQHHAECPERDLLASAWGLGWLCDTWDDVRVIGHGGNTIGQSAALYLFPDHRAAIALLTNVGGRSPAIAGLLGEVVSEVVGVDMPPRPAPATEPIEQDLARFQGVYERYTVRTEVDLDDEGLRATMTMDGPTAAAMGLTEPISFRLQPMEPGVFVASVPMFGDGWVPFRFYGGEADRPRFLHTGARASRRAG